MVDVRSYSRKRKLVTAFRWDGEPVEGFERVNNGFDGDGNPSYCLTVSPFLGPSYARPGDWVVTEDGGDRAVRPEDFERDYEPVAAAGRMAAMAPIGIPINQTTTRPTED